MAINTKDLVKYANSGLNVLLSGPHGVGKTAIIKEVFNDVFGEYYTNWRYFSASTLDPWVDFIGIPKNYTRPDGKEVFGIIPPDHFTGEENVQAIFFDEINRAEEKTLNALMELIQFRSINGRKFPNLKCIWAAENPADDKDNQYMVKELDPAQKDRFQIQIPLKNELNMTYMKKKYGNDAAQIASEWWSDFKTQISPRRLDDMLLGFMNGFTLSHYVPVNVDANKLQKSLSAINEISSIRSIVKSGKESIKEFFTLDKVISLSPIFKSNPELAIEIAEHVDKEIANKVSDFSSPFAQNKIKERIQEKELENIRINPRKIGKKKNGDVASEFDFLDDIAKPIPDNKMVGLDIKSINIVNFPNRGSFSDDFYAQIVNFNSKVDDSICQNRKMKTWRIDLPSYINTYHFQKFIHFVSATNNGKVQVTNFIKNIAMISVHSRNHKAIAALSKICGCSIMRQKFKINNDEAKNIISFAKDKSKRSPNFSLLFDN
jgi:DNA polymerase III delta prime subunit